MSKEKESFTSEISDVSAAQDTNIIENTEDYGDQALGACASEATNRNLADKYGEISQLQELAQLNKIMSASLDKIEKSHSAKSLPENQQGDPQLALEIEFLQNKLQYYTMLLENFNSSCEEQIRVPSQEENLTKDLNKLATLIRQSSSTESLQTGCKQSNEQSSETQNPFGIANSPATSSDSYPSSLSSETWTAPSETNNEAAASYSTSSCSAQEGANEKSSNSNSSERTAAKRSSKTTLKVNRNNTFFYTSATRRIVEHYTKLFDFEEYRLSSTLSAYTYTQVLSIKYITIPLSRLLIEELIDFIDFLNGTEIELREPKSNLYLATAEERQLGYVRENFPIGVQQEDLETVDLFFEEVDCYVWDNNHSSRENSDPFNIVAIQHLRFYGVENNSDASNHGTESNDQNCVKDVFRLQKIDPKIEAMDMQNTIERLEFFNIAIWKSVLRCLSDIRLILDFCVVSRHFRCEIRLKSYLCGVKCMLYRLYFLRRDCVSLLLNCDDFLEKVRVMNILKVKTQIATEFLLLMNKMLEVNSEFLGTIYI